ncbi:acyl-homoserine lactone acylase PvdQ [Algoriphagus ratkowskyi]|uniref:Acylase n=1 Tax=Algoriphagus ratkowskyi TaxID=57028 RepID=A0A2W7S2P3_9BACT|nr:acylase [Algoriphagus ratkowskyi]PZX61209.1 acyl-homoserine lactone acylase PvdQ [Algoriphagus ratkowskyi]TXD79328.1 acylase [Algoriphagus ratkowskyi]
MKFRLLFFALPVLIWSCEPKELSESERWEDTASRVEILRDDYGIPHIYGKSDADAVFGLLYAQCEDDFRRVERNYIWATGRLAELEGPDAIFSDLRANLYMTEAEAKAAYETAPDWLKKLCVAFADGVNYYLATHPEVIPQVITRYEPWMPMFFSEGSIGGDIEQIPTPGIKAFYSAKETDVMALNEPAVDRESLLDEPKGSNGIAINGKMTASGNAMLLINPHTSFYFRPEVHVVSEEGLNAYGAVTWGQFFIYQGFNEKTGWMHTSTQVDFIDEFVEEVTENDGKYEYQYGDESRAVEEFQISLKYKSGAELKERPFTFYRTHHGPITHQINDKWVATKINWDPVNALIQSFTRTKLSNHDEFKKMMDIRTNSSNNTVFADADGNIAYFHGNFIPKRNDGYDFSKPVDGSDPKSDWQGLHPVDETIMILNPGTGWIQNCNSTPFTAAGKFSPKKENYPFYMAPDQENYRGIHAMKVLNEASKLTLDGLINLAHDPYLPAFAELIPMLIKAYEAKGVGDPKFTEAIKVLETWDYRTSKESVAMSLAHFFGMNFMRDHGNINNLLTFNQDENTKIPNPTATELLATFGKTLEEMNADFGSWNTPWSEINRFQRLTGEIDAPFDDSKEYTPVGLASGTWGALAAFGAKTYPGTKRLYGYRGNSFVTAVEFGEKVKAKSILAGGQSSDPNSPHFYDQTQDYVDGKFKDVAFYREDVEARMEERYIPGKR